MDSFDKIFDSNYKFFNNILLNYKIDITLDYMQENMSGIFLVKDRDPKSPAFRIMGTYKTPKGEKTKKKQLYSFGIKDYRKLNSEDKYQEIFSDFEKFIKAFEIIKRFYEIKELAK